jgi:adenine-specific DNA-methyltransferase
LFNSRNKAFSDDDVLQENVILHLIKAAKQGNLIISQSSDDTFSDYSEREVSFSTVVYPTDKDRFIRIPEPNTEELVTIMVDMCKLEELDIQVSTGPVVDFRIKQDLLYHPNENSVPLIYPSHFENHKLIWPNYTSKKPNALLLNDTNLKQCFPNGYYVVVRRFSSKEEKKRIVANLIKPSHFKGVNWVAFENHLNVFHRNKKGLNPEVAKALVKYLNSDFVDQIFRSFNGHTQVNATDLRSLRYPNFKGKNFETGITD